MLLWARWAGFVLCLVAAGLFVFHRDVGAPLFALVVALCCLVVLIAPWRQGFQPRRLALLPSLAGLSFLAALVSGIFPFDVNTSSTFRAADGFVFVAYGLLAAWILLLSRRLSSGLGWTTLLDVAAAAIGASLAFWTVAVGAMFGGQQIESALLIASYPMFDIILVTLAVHLALRLARFAPAMAWLLGSLVLLLVLDTAMGLVLLTSGVAYSAFAAAQIFGFFGFAVAASHPTLVELTQPHPDLGARREGRERIVLIMLTLTPAILAAGIPPESTADGVVRAALVAALLGVVSLRVWRTLANLSQSESHHYFRATHDHLTGLLNRSALMDELDSRLRVDAEHGRCTAAMFLDIDYFKEINDTWGHAAGDRILHHVADGLPHRLRREDVLARHGGDEFVVLASVEDLADVSVLADRVLAFFERPVKITSSHTHSVSPSIGVAVSRPDDGVRGTDLIRRADEAMYEAKRRGRARWILAGQV
ncbi:MAG: GGDEF domain-containing protein [Mobilicoccus sp.]|nr:GGDEF domain-containing protein [Mobilicoccus sp.]